MATMIIDCFDNRLRGVKDPYTGKEMTFKMAIGNGKPRLFSDNAYSPSTPVKSSVTAYHNAHTRDGIVGALPDAAPVTCPYTGEVMRLESSDEGYYWSGGFDPTLPLFTADRFIEQVLQRAGTGPTIPPIPETNVLEKNIDIPTDVNIETPSLGNEVEDAVRDIIDGKKTKKVVAVNGRKRAKK